jgi:DNA-directed RNA polymerase specialized sigma24 family protein
LGDHDLPAPDPTASRGSTDLAWRVLATLPPKQRATLVLRIYEDLADAEIAEILGSSEAAVRSNASRGLAALRTSISREDLEDR